MGKGFLQVCDNKSGRKETLTPSLLSLFFLSPTPSPTAHTPLPRSSSTCSLSLSSRLCPGVSRRPRTTACGSLLLATKRQSSLGAVALVGTLRAGDLAAMRRAGISHGRGTEQSLAVWPQKRKLLRRLLPSLDPRKEDNGARKEPFSQSHQSLLQWLPSERQWAVECGPTGGILSLEVQVFKT